MTSTSDDELRRGLHTRLVAGPLGRLGNAFDAAALAALGAACQANVDPSRHGDLALHFARFAGVPARPTLEPSDCELGTEVVRLGRAEALLPSTAVELRLALLALGPWRKGPFQSFGVDIDAEWRSNLKWARLEGAVDWSGARVLDVGCGNGYYALRALGRGAQAVLGIDPGLGAVLQFLALCEPAPWLSAAVLPLRFEDLPTSLAGFDIVLSLGVLGHRRDPEAHLGALAARTRRDGALLLETLIWPGDDPSDERRVFEPSGRYAAMRNVHRLPTLGTLIEWVVAAGFESVVVLDVTGTTPSEQRRTAWMPLLSLADFLDPTDPGRTREGYPAPVRVALRAIRR